MPFFEKGINNALLYLSQTQEQWDAVKKAKVGKSDERIFLHIPYHPQNPSSGFVQNIWRNLVLSPPGKENLNQLTNWEGHHVPIKRLIVAFHRNPKSATLFEVGPRFEMRLYQIKLGRRMPRTSTCSGRT
jgi:hypothetical protein